jgi:hypothetical protein
MRSFPRIPALALLALAVIPLVGCGGSDNNTPTPAPSVSSSTPVRSQYVGDWEGTWSISTRTRSFGGSGTISVQSDGRYVLFLENYPNKGETEFTDVTITGTMSSNGYFSTKVPGITDDDTLAGAFELPLVPSDRLKMYLTRTHYLVTSGVTSGAGGVTGDTQGLFTLTRK